jgi:hypothetical protein
LDPSSTLRFDIAPDSSTATVQVGGNATLAGTLQVFAIDGADPTSGNGRTLLTAGSTSGAFSNVASGGRVTAYSSNGVTLGDFDGVIAGTYKADYSNNKLTLSDFQPHAAALNISTRLKVTQYDENHPDGAGIAGFIINGGSSKKVLLRGIGPSLASKGVTDALPDPFIELHDSSGALIQQNDNWQDTQANDISATGIAPTDPKESAIVASLNPGTYTVILHSSGSSTTTAVGLVEVYDLDAQPSGSEFANLSTRAMVGTDDRVMIGGVIVGADTPANMVVRALGPSLTSQGVANALADPVLELHDSTGALLAMNDDWQTNNTTAASVFQSEGLAPSDPHESALQMTLAPGSYTAIVRGKANSQGTALVEFYKLN